MTLQELHSHLAKLSLGDLPTDHEILSFMVLLHTHEIVLKSNVALEDVRVRNPDNEIVLPAVTRSHAAEIVSSLWTTSHRNGRHDFWHTKYMTETPYESLSDVPDTILPSIQTMKSRLESTPFVKAVRES